MRLLLVLQQSVESDAIWQSVKLIVIVAAVLFILAALYIRRKSQ